MRVKRKTWTWGAALTVGAAAVSGSSQAQHISIDGRLSPAQTLVGPNYSIGANLGKQVGGNLFHSFGIFGLSTGESATFSGPATVTNVIGRVTGGSQSSINGAIKSTITGANLYLINPAGIVFGPNATINVSGSFYASTADYLKHSDGARFQATNPDGSTLTAAPPAAFGFLNAAPPAITVNGATLTAPTGQTLGLIGGPINLTGATLNAPRGTIHVAAVASSGEVPVVPQDPSGSTVTQMAPISITQGSALNIGNFFSGAGGAGSMFVNAGAVAIDNSTLGGVSNGPAAGGPIRIAATSLSLTNGAAINSLSFGSGDSGPITITATGSLSLVNGSIVSNTFGTGNAGAVTVTAGNGSLLSGGEVASVTFGPARAGDVTINIGGTLTIDGTNPGSNAGSGIVSQTVVLTDAAGNILVPGAGTGNAGQVTINAQNLSITNHAVISTSSFGSGNAGQVVVNAGSILLAGSGVIFSDSFSTGPAGPVNVTAATLSMTSMGNISSTAQDRGDAGDITVNVSGALTIDGAGATEMFHSGIFALSLLPNGGAAGQVNVSAGTLTLLGPNGDISTSTFGAGAGGHINIVADNLSISNQGSIGSQTFGSGNAGQVVVTAGNLTVNAANISTTSFGPGSAGQLAVNAGSIFLSGNGVIFSDSFSTGPAGPVNVTAGTLSMNSSGHIASTAQDQGNAGDVTVNVSGALTIDGTGATLTAHSGIFALSLLPNGGNAGQISVSAGTLTLMNPDSDISTTTFGSGAGGRVNISANNLFISNLGSIGSLAFGSGDAGQVTVGIGGLTINGGSISTATFGSGTGGSIDVAATGNVLLTGPDASIASGSSGTGDAGSIRLSAANLTLKNGASISTQAATANGGNIVLSVGDFLYLVDSKITTSVKGSTGNGGNIAIDPQLVVLDNSDIIAQAVAGHGGNILINANNFIASNDSLVSASSQLGISGTVDLVGPRVDLNGSLVVLPSDLRDVAEVARTSCDARTRKLSSLVDAGHGGLPQDTETTIPALYIVNRDLRLDLAPAAGRNAGGGALLPSLPPTAHLTMSCG